MGSPPRVRGKAFGFPRLIPGLGITPAYAGKSRARKAAAAVRRDHPRVCGEKLDELAAAQIHTGSPPRVQGKGWPGNRNHPGPGITPACAGKSIFGPLGGVLGQDHPRVCGEKWSLRLQKSTIRGSPPRVRGKVDCASRNIPHSGITPACAGKRRNGMDWNNGNKDHPRACGEKSGQRSMRWE